MIPNDEKFISISMVHRNRKLGRVEGKIASVDRRLAEVNRWDQRGIVRLAREELRTCMRAYGRYVIDGGVDRARKQCKDRLFNGYLFSVFTIMLRACG